MMVRLMLVVGMVVLVGCGDDDESDAATPDAAGPDATMDAPQSDGTTTDAPGGDAPVADGSVADSASRDVNAADGAVTCTMDAQCMSATEWCVGGECVECDNSGLLCDIACDHGWMPYERNGCFPCECAPPQRCASDAECDGGQECYAGNFCWDWCPEDDPSCCLGNQCSAPGCESSPPSGCWITGCAFGSQCTDVAGSCVGSSCACADGDFVCTEDCGGGTCVPD